MTDQTPTYYVTTPAHTEPVVVAATTNCPVAPRQITAAEAATAACGQLPSLQAALDAGLLQVREGGPLARTWCDVPNPERWVA